MTRQERHDEVVKAAASLNLTVEHTSNNSWHVWGPDGSYRGMLAYNQRSGVWKIMGGVLDKAHFGDCVELLNLLAIRTMADQ